MGRHHLALMGTPSYEILIGTGGIGSGMFLAVEGNETIGREESRMVDLLEQRDYCKLHIVCHYVKRLLWPSFVVMPIGKVGRDSVGAELCEEMEAAGLDVRYVKTSERRTSLSICFVYPDGSGGNLTTQSSACSEVTPAYVATAEETFERLEGRGVALAVPEVPFEARMTLLEMASRHGFFRVAAVVSGEVPRLLTSGMLDHVDLLALNLHEAAAIASLPSEEAEAGEVVSTAIARLTELNPRLHVSCTAGRLGSWVWDGLLSFAPSIPVDVVNTAGAGDAHLAGMIAGHIGGLDTAGANELGALVAGMKVTQSHAIHVGLDRETLRNWTQTLGTAPSGPVREFLNADWGSPRAGRS